MTISLGSLFPLLTLVATAGIILYEYRRTDDLVTPLHLAWGFFGFFVLISYFYTGAYGEDSQLHPFATPDATAIIALAHLFLAFTFLTLGYYSTLPRSLGSLTIKQLPESELPPSAARGIGLYVFTIGLISTAVFIAKNGGIGELLAARNIFVFRTASGSLRYWIGLQIGLFAGLALYLSGARYTDRHLPAYIIGIVTVGVFFAMHTRIRVIFGVLLIGLYAWYSDPRITPRRLGTIAGIFFLALGLFRPVEMLLQGLPPERAISYIHGYLVNEPGGMFVYPDYFQGYMALVEGVSSRVPLQWGRTLVAIPWLPLELFEMMRDVATDPTELTEIAIYGYDRPETGVIAGGFGVLYLNFHLPGLFLGATTLGVLFRWAHVVWERAGDRAMVGALYFVTMYYFFIMLAKTPLAYHLLLVLVVMRGIWFLIDIMPHAPFESAWGNSSFQELYISVNRIYTAVEAKLETLLSQYRRGSTTRTIARRVNNAWTRSETKDALSKILRQ